MDYDIFGSITTPNGYQLTMAYHIFWHVTSGLIHWLWHTKILRYCQSIDCEQCHVMTVLCHWQLYYFCELWHILKLYDTVNPLTMSYDMLWSVTSQTIHWLWTMTCVEVLRNRKSFGYELWLWFVTELSLHWTDYELWHALKCYVTNNHLAMKYDMLWSVTSLATHWLWNMT